jgi:hypothetical protein
MARRLALAALAAALLAGCGEKAEPPAPRLTAVTGTLDLARPAAGPPDAGTTAGHRTPDATASTKRTALAFSGRVEPATSRVTLRPAGGKAAPVDVADDGSFRARAGRLKRGVNRFVLEGRAASLAPWKVDIAITRRR